MADVGGIDTSSYPRGTLPVSPLDLAGKLGGLQQQKLSIDQAKLDQANQGLNYLARAVTSLGPNASKDQYKAVGADMVKAGLVPENMLHIWNDRIDAAPDSQTIFKQTLGAVADHQQQLSLQTGAPATATDNATTYQGKVDPMTGGFTPATQAPIQVPPTQTNVNNQPTLPNGQPNPNYLQPGIVGPSGPAGFRPASRGLPVVAPPNPASGAPIPVARPRMVVQPLSPVSGPTGPTTQTGYDFKQRFAGEPVVTGAAPGVAEAIKTVGDQSGKDYASALQRAGNIQADIQPDMAVLDIVKGKAAGDFGPGTDGLNQIKKLATTWLPNVDPKLINDSKDYDTVKKYLIQGARAAGNTGTNDQLAAAFEGSPNTTMNTATIESIVKTRVALKKMEAAQALMANKEGIAPDQFSRWKAKNQNNFDPRAFGWDMMDSNARRKLVDKLNPKEYQKLETSIQFAHDAELIDPPAKK